MFIDGKVVEKRNSCYPYRRLIQPLVVTSMTTHPYIDQLTIYLQRTVSPQEVVDLKINETLQTGAVRNRTYRGAKVSICF